MRRARRLARSRRSETGAVLVMVAVMLPVLIGFSGLVIDVGNWFAHKRHLQTQADAGALAGASQFRFPCSDRPILDEVSKYSSVDSVDAGFNPQIGATEAGELHQEINSPTWYDQASPVDPDVRTGGPCTAKMIDVKLTETNLPWWLKALSVPYINTQARVEIRQQDISKGALPVGVPEVGPKTAKAIFVNESTGSIVASTNLARTGTSGGLAIWSSVSTPVPVTVNTAKIGVRIVLSGSTSTACGDPLVDCYGAGTSAAIAPNVPGLAHIRGYDNTTAATAAIPRVRDVQLFSGGCEDGYFTAAASYPCTPNVGAIVDFAGAAITTTRVLAKKTGANNSTAVELTAPAASGGRWTGPVGFSVAASSGASTVELMWRTGCNADRTKPCGNGGTNLATLTGATTVQRIYSGGEALTASGPIKMLRVAENAIPGANSFPSCAACTHNLTVTVGLKPSLSNAQSVNDPIVTLKVVGGGSQNQALDCDPNLPNIRDELEQGCEPKYTVNPGTPCPNRTALWASAQPWNCVVINTGTTVGQVTQGLNKRILGARNASCTQPNNWASFPNIDKNDPRIVQVFLAPFGAFNGSGGATVPVTGFATFYATGWDGGGCQGAGDDPAGQGSIVGHFIKYIDTLNNGGGGEEFCDFDSLGSCVAVFTR